MPLAKRDLTERVPWQDEPDPTMPSMNPFTQARNVALKKQSQVAEMLGVETTDIIRLEQAIYTYIPEKFVNLYKEKFKLPDNWEAGYRNFQRLMRIAAPRPIYGVFQRPPGEYSFRRWRLHNWPTMSQMGWCKAFCIHPSAVYALEQDATLSVSADILSALIEANVMSEDQAREFAGQIRFTLKRRKAAGGKVANGKR